MRKCANKTIPLIYRTYPVTPMFKLRVKFLPAGKNFRDRISSQLIQSTNTKNVVKIQRSKYIYICQNFSNIGYEILKSQLL